MQRRFSFRAVDDTERLMCDLPRFRCREALRRLNVDDSELPDAQIDRRLKRAVNQIIQNHEDKPTVHPGERHWDSAYMMICSTPVRDRGGIDVYWGVPIIWTALRASDRLLRGQTERNYGKAVTFIALRAVPEAQRDRFAGWITLCPCCTGRNRMWELDHELTVNLLFNSWHPRRPTAAEENRWRLVTAKNAYGIVGYFAAGLVDSAMMRPELELVWHEGTILFTP